MKYQSTNDEILSFKHVAQGMIVKIIEEAYMTTSQTNGKDYWNAKVELPDGSHKLANVGGITGDLFTKAWGEDTKDWIGKLAEVSIRTSKNTGNEYIVLVSSESFESSAKTYDGTDEEQKTDLADIPF